MKYSKYFKPILDVVIALISIFLLIPIFLFLLLINIFSHGYNVLFIQERLGLYGKTIRVYKFKTMRDGGEGDSNLLSEQERITSIGKWLRKLSLDELPQLFNVVKGEMSLIGPRPLLLEYLPLYSNDQKRRHNVKPGITGWAQVNGRNEICWQKKFQLDLFYVDNLTFCLDLKIIFLTCSRIFSFKNIKKNDLLYAEKFKGNFD